jgi:hypothetical protein
MIFYAHSKLDTPMPTLEWSNKLAFTKFLSENEDYKGAWIVEIEKEKGKRTLKQNDFMWLYLDHIEKETGNLSTDLHELFKRKFLPPIPKKILGVEFRLPASTTELSKQEMSEYLDKISAFTEIPIPEPLKKEFGIDVAYPDEKLTPKF